MTNREILTEALMRSGYALRAVRDQSWWTWKTLLDLEHQLRPWWGLDAYEAMCRAQDELDSFNDGSFTPII